MHILMRKLIIVLLIATSSQAECDVCHATNNEACHSETEFSLCINGKPNGDFITCPKDYVCTAGPYVCYPRKEAEPSCKLHRNLCGICSVNKVFACVNETTIAFCYGEDKPVQGAEFSYCLGDTVCDINSKDGFCTESKLVQPSCITSDGLNTTEVPSSSKQSASTTSEPKFLPTTPRSVSKEAPTSTEEIMAKRTTRIETIQPATPTTKTPIITRPTTTTPKVDTTKVSSTITQAITIKTPKTFVTTTTTSTTTPQPRTTQTSATGKRSLEPRSPIAICRDAGRTGSYYADDPTCTTFIVCYISGGSLAGIRKQCKPGQYFPPGAVYCSTKKPDICI